MPYNGELANKTSHFDIVDNPDVQQFLKDCNYLKEPSKEEAVELCKFFQRCPSTENVSLPENIISFDGSYHESAILDRLPSTRIGYVKLGSMLIEMQKFKNLRVEDGRFVDPFRVASLQNDNSPLTFTLPSANIKWKGCSTVRESFRTTFDEQMLGNATRFDKSRRETSLRSTLFILAHLRPGGMGTDGPDQLKLARCPNNDCSEENIVLFDTEDAQHCKCGMQLFPTDCLRVWETISETQSNVEGLNRVMNAVEHLLPIHYIRRVFEESPASLSGLAFFVDGPLAVFGNSAWLHASILRYLDHVNSELIRQGHKPILMVGLQKTGQLVEYFSLLEKFVPAGHIMAMNDLYRYKNVLGNREPSKNGFGAETYYGQDFLLKTKSGRYFVFAMPYPFGSKSSIKNFLEEKTKLEYYSELDRAVALIENFESDLYENAVIPIALAHRYTSISLTPGSEVLDVLTRRSLTSER